jgi:hypothetical protein
MSSNENQERANLEGTRKGKEGACKAKWASEKNAETNTDKKKKSRRTESGTQHKKEMKARTQKDTRPKEEKKELGGQSPN